MKKLFSMVLCAMMALTLAGCGGSGDDSSTYTYSSELDIKNLDSADAEDGCSFTALHAIIDGLMKPAKDGTTTYVPVYGVGLVEFTDAAFDQVGILVQSLGPVIGMQDIPFPSHHHLLEQFLNHTALHIHHHVLQHLFS